MYNWYVPAECLGKLKIQVPASTKSSWDAVTSSGLLYNSYIRTTANVITPTVTVNGNYTYNGTAQTPASNAVTVNMVTVDGTGLHYGTDYNYTATNNTNVGTATVDVTLNSHYRNETLSGNFTIGKKVLTVTADDKSKSIGEADPVNTVTIDGFANSETIANLGGTLAFSTTGTAGTLRPGGQYDITPRGLTSNNYDILFANGKLDVTKLTQSALTITNLDSAYNLGVSPITLGTSGGSSDGSVTYSVTDGGTIANVSGDTLTISSYGTFKIIAVMAGNGAYDDAVSAEYAVTVTDVTAPTGTISIGTNSWGSFWNNVSLGLFSKTAQGVAITASDDSHDDTIVEYLLSATEIATEAEAEQLPGWQTYTGAFDINPDSKYIVYAKLADASGNAAIINSAGVVLYTDSAQDTQSISHTRFSAADRTANVALNGNTVAGVSIGGAPLALGSDYTVSGGVIAFKETWLNTLAASDTAYTLAVSYNPLGESYPSGPLPGSDAPGTTAISLSVGKAASTLALTANDAAVYGTDNVTLTASLAGAGAAPTGSVEFFEGTASLGSANLVDGLAQTTVTLGMDDHDLKAVYAGDGNYLGDDDTISAYNVGKAPQSALAITGLPGFCTYGGSPVTLGTAGGSSGGTVTYESSDTSVAVISGNTLSILAAGSFSVTATMPGNDNYNPVSSAVFPVTVRQKEVAITGLSAENKVYDGSAAASVAGTAGIDGKVNGDDLAVSPGTAAFEDKNAGTGKKVIFSGYALDGADKGNYSLGGPPAGITADIAPFAITVAANDAEKYFGEDDFALTYTVRPGLIAGDTLAGTLTYIGTAVGQHDIIEDEPFANANYAITFVKGIFTVKPTPKADSVGAAGAISKLPNTSGIKSDIKTPDAAGNAADAQGTAPVPADVAEADIPDGAPPQADGNPGAGADRKLWPLLGGAAALLGVAAAIAIHGKKMTKRV
ncbi:MAG: YDG domain-containing protein [Clostridiales Family XIII bacterium]|nr:YDG domain-containing protein [Clostridiales Family XIII bacterium]